jgi:hypothetical protein
MAHRIEESEVDRTEQPTWREWSGFAAAIGSAMAVAVCCVGPAVLLALGVTGVHFIEVIEPYRPFIILLEIAGYLYYKQTRRGRGCRADGACDEGGGRLFQQVVFWVALTVAVGGIVALAI